MKIHAILLVTAAAITFSDSVEASVPDPSVDLNTCLSWAQTQQGKAAFMAASGRCNALDDCNKNYSDNVEDWRDCKFKAESKFLAEMEVIEGVVPTSSEGAAPVSSSGVTDPANSFYEMRGPEHKGFENSTQGPN
ncbi:MAG: hypothetical protein K2P93_06380 [Alphaproteobacteria bacterium]|nr:hypothetical protein [Alphaproteobacteria bacterium]